MTTRRSFLVQSSMIAAAGPMLARGEGPAPTADMPRETYRIARTDLVVSRIAYGCAELGGAWDDTPVSRSDIAKADRLVHTAYDNGIALFDHADLYALGKSESVFGEVLRNSPGFRNRIIIQSKCGQVLADAARKTAGPVRVDLSARHIVQSVEGSLGRLGTDWLDILLLHAPTTLVRPDEVAGAFDTLHRSGKVRHFGVSNFTAQQVHLLSKGVRAPLIANQVPVGLGNPGLLRYGEEFTLALAGVRRTVQPFGDLAASGTFDYCRSEGIRVQAYSPVRGITWEPKDDAGPGIKALAQKLKELAEEKGCTPPAVALAWLLHHPAGILPITGSGNPTHIAENCAADRIALTDDEWYSLFAAAADAETGGDQT